MRIATIQLPEVRALAHRLSPVRCQPKLVHERTGEIRRAAASLTKLRNVQRDLSDQHEPKVEALKQPECYPDLDFFKLPVKMAQEQRAQLNSNHVRLIRTPRYCQIKLHTHASTFSQTKRV